MTDLCLLCEQATLTPIYEPIGTRRGITIYLCQEDGLLQSLPRFTKGDGIARVSHNADYGNLRVGKLSRSRPDLDFIRYNLSGFQPKWVLDVGASRGAFVQELLAWQPGCQVTAIEPDTSIIPLDLYAIGTVQVVNNWIEDIEFDGDYDLIYCSHTLEHLDDSLFILSRLREALTPDGWLFVEVPNIRGVMGILDIVEEVFLDKHNFHFTMTTLSMMLFKAGFVPIHLKIDAENVTVLARKCEPILKLSDNEAPIIKPIIQAYASDLQKNRWQLKRRVAITNHRIQHIPGPALIAAGGRILSAMVEAGLDTSLFEGIIDPYLPLDEVHGLPVLKLDMYTYVKPKVILVCSRSEVLVEAARQEGAEVVLWN